MKYQQTKTINNSRVVLSILISCLTCLGTWAIPVRAGFGTSPPYIKNEQTLFPGGFYEEKIFLLRSTAAKPAKIRINIAPSTVSSWLSVDRGKEFTIPAGEIRTPVVFKAKVPTQTTSGLHNGKIYIEIIEQASSVGNSIRLAGQVDVQLKISGGQLATKLAGRILLQVESAGLAWYVNPINLERVALGRPEDAFRVLTRLGLGVSEVDYGKLEKNGAQHLAGRILLRPHQRGEAYYVEPIGGRLIYLGGSEDALEIMRSHGLGVTNIDLTKITETTN